VISGTKFSKKVCKEFVLNAWGLRDIGHKSILFLNAYIAAIALMFEGKEWRSGQKSKGVGG